MIRSRGPLAAILLAILAASCGGRPSVTVVVGGETMPTQVVSSTEGTPCSTSHGDGPAPPRDPTIVRQPTPLAIRVDAEPGSQIRVLIYEIDTSTSALRLLPASGPLEDFTVTSGVTYQSRSIVASRSYEVWVDVSRSVLGFRSEVGHAFRVRVQPP